MRTLVIHTKNKEEFGHAGWSLDYTVKRDVPEDVDILIIVGYCYKPKFTGSFFSKIKRIKVLDLSNLEIKKDDFLCLEAHDYCNKLPNSTSLKEIILPYCLERFPFIKNLPKLEKITGWGLGSVHIGDSYVKHIENCPNLHEIDFGVNVKELIIRDSSIRILNLPDNDIKLFPYSFAYNQNLIEVHLPNDIDYLPKRLFEGCVNLMKVTGGKNIKRIEVGAFGGCDKLKELPFEKSILEEKHFLSIKEWSEYIPSLRVDSDSVTIWSPFNRPVDKNGSENWKPYKKGIVLRDDLVWCFNNFEFYTIDYSMRELLKDHHLEYIEFEAPTITFTENDKGSIINRETKDHKIVKIHPNKDVYSDIISFYFSEFDVLAIMKETEEYVNALDISSIIENYKTHDYYHCVKLNSDTEGVDADITRCSSYSDVYMECLLPSLNFYHEEARYPSNQGGYFPDDRTLPCRLLVDLNLAHKHPEVRFDNRFRGLSFDKTVKESKKEEETIRENARKNYNREKHILSLVNEKLSIITSKKLEIESKYHINEALLKMGVSQ